MTYYNIIKEIVHIQHENLHLQKNMLFVKIIMGYVSLFIKIIKEIFMKRKLFLSLLVSAMLVFLFAFGVSAEVAIYDDAPVKENITVSKDDIVVFKDGYSCLSAYISSDVTATNNGGAGTLVVRELFDFSYINEKTGKNYGFGDIVSIDIPQGVTYIGGYGLTYATNIKKISFPDTITGFGGFLLKGCTSLEECVFEHDENDGLTNIGPEFFADCPNLRAISLPDCITSFGWNVNYDGGYFKNCTNLSAIHLPKRLEIMYGGTDAMSVFGDLTNVYFTNEAFTYDDIPSKPDIYYFPSGLAKMTGTPFKNCKNLNSILVFGQGTTAITRSWEFEGAESGNGARPTVVFLGDTTSINVNGWNVSAVYFANANDIDASTAGVSGNATIYYCNAEGNTNHLTERSVDMPASCEVNAAKVISCFCGYETRQEVAGTALSHNYDYVNGKATLVSISYISYSAKGEKIVTCANCGENGELEADALFDCIGYSAPEDANRGGIVIGYSINHTAIAEYEKVTGKTVNYGVYAVGKDNLGANDIFDTNGKAAEGVVSAEVEKNAYVSFEFKIVGFDDTTKDKKLAMGAYVAVTKDNATEYSYIQLGTPDEGAKYAFTSYTEYLKSIS